MVQHGIKAGSYSLDKALPGVWYETFRIITSVILDTRGVCTQVQKCNKVCKRSCLLKMSTSCFGSKRPQPRQDQNKLIMSKVQVMEEKRHLSADCSSLSMNGSD